MKICQYDYFEKCYLASVPGNPFDVEWMISVTCPNGAIKKIYGFFDGGNRFAFRFMPEQLGEYRYITDCKQPELSGKSGSFCCIPPREGNHGKVSVKNRYWFSYADGTPYFEAGTTCYAWIHQSAELRQQTLETLSAGYFNKLRMCVFPKWYEHNHRQPELYPFAGNPENGFDYETPNVCFFQHLESCISALESLGIEADIILFHPYESSDWRFNWMTERQDRQYLRYITARLSAFHNVWWSLANEYDLLQTGYKRKKAAWKRLIRFVHDCDPYGHLLSIHQLSRMYDYRDPNVTHCSIQRTELYLTAEYTDTWREKYGKPVVIDECVYEGNLNAWWGGITAQELVRRFWEAAARGGYMSHGETYSGENIWWSHGGRLYGESAPRIRFLREVMEKCPNIQLTSESGLNNTARAIAGTDTQLVYFGYYQPHRYTLHLLGGGKFKVTVIDTWNMTMEELSEIYTGTAELSLPGEPYIAVLAVAEAPGKASAFTRDSVFEEMRLTPGGRKLLRILKRLCPSYYSGMLTMTLNQCSRQAGGILDGKAGDGMLRIVNQGQLVRGMVQLIFGALFQRRREETL